MKSLAWNAPGVTYATSREDKAWTAELKIPFPDVGLRGNERWLINICRNNYYPADPNDKNPQKWKLEQSSWPPVYGAFYHTDFFASLFLED